MNQFKVVCIVDAATKQKLLSLLLQAGIELEYIGISKVAEPKPKGWGGGFTSQLFGKKK